MKEKRKHKELGLYKWRYNKKQVKVPGEFATIKSMPPTYADSWKYLLKYMYKGKMLYSVCLEAGIANRKALKYFNKEGLITISPIKNRTDKVIKLLPNQYGKKQARIGKLLITLPFKVSK